MASHMWLWLKKNGTELSAITSIMTLVVAAAGFGMTSYQLSETKRSLEAANAYQIQRDARDTINEIMEKENLSKYLNGDDSAAVVEKAQIDAWVMNNFYMSVYRLSKSGSISDQFVDSYKKEFCEFHDRERVQSLVAKMLAKKNLGQGFLSMKEGWCGK